MRINYRTSEIRTIKDSKKLLFRCSIFVYKKEFENKNTCKLKFDVTDYSRTEKVSKDIYNGTKKIRTDVVLTNPILSKKGTIVNILSKDIDDFTKEVSYRLEIKYREFIVKENQIDIIITEKKQFNLLED